jgi:hypothetical protein
MSRKGFTISHMISEVIRESDELEHFLLSRGWGKSRTFMHFSGVNEVPIAETTLEKLAIPG